MGTLEIKEPEGWDDGVLTLDRNKEYHSLVEFYEQPLTFDDAVATNLSTHEELPGGLEWLVNIEYVYGLKAIVNILIEISENEGITYETIFLGTVALDTVKEIDFYKAEYGITRDDFWAKLINRKAIPVNILDATDLDGNPRTSITPINLELLTQVVKEQFVRETGYNNNNEGLFTSFTTAVDTVTYLIFDTSRNTLDEIEERFEYGTQISDELPTDVEKYLFRAKFGGTYRLQGQIRFTVIFNTSLNVDVRWFYAVRQSGTLTATQIGSTSSAAGVIQIFDNGTESLDTTVTLQPGDEIYVYARMNLSTNATATYFPDYDTDPSGVFAPVYTSFSVTANTVFPTTEVSAFLIADAFKGVLSRITGYDNVLVSDYMVNGCGSLFAILKGLHLRGFSFIEKIFAQSLDDLFVGYNPIFNVGLGYIQGSNQVEILPKADFYNKTPILNLDYVNMIERSYDLDKIVKSIEIGYEKSLSDVPGGLNVTQTKRWYNTDIPTAGIDEKILSKFIAADLPIEETRRQKVEDGKDWKLDEFTFIINVIDNDGQWNPAFTEAFNAITGLDNEEARYNIRLSVARNMQRWLNYVSGGLQIPYAQEIHFRNGEGNYDMTSQLNPDDCEASDETPEPVLSEKGNFEVTDDFLYMPIMYTFDHPLTFTEYKLIRDNRKNAIGVSRSNTNHKPCFIMNCKYKPTRAIATFEVLLGVNSPIGYVPEPPDNQRFYTLTGELTFEGFAPELFIGEDRNFNSLTGELIFTGIEPTLYIGPPA